MSDHYKCPRYSSSGPVGNNHRGKGSDLNKTLVPWNRDVIAAYGEIQNPESGRGTLLADTYIH